MLTYIQTHILVSCLIVLFSLLLLDALACRFDSKARGLMSNILLVLAVFAGIVILFAVSADCVRLDTGWRLLLSIIMGPALGCLIYAIRYAIVCLFIELYYKLTKK